jgi:hypothetical protein
MAANRFLSLFPVRVRASGIPQPHYRTTTVVSLLRDQVRFTDREGSHGQSRAKLAAVSGAGHEFRETVLLNLQTERRKLSFDRDEGVRIRQTA